MALSGKQLCELSTKGLKKGLSLGRQKPFKKQSASAMVVGIGVDLCDIGRMKKAVARDGFVRRVFSEAEIEYAEGRGDPAAHYAAAFAAKEALAKAGGWGLWNMGVCSCEVVRTESGPQFHFSSDLKERLAACGVQKVFLSISHESNMAVAMVVLEG